MEQQSSGFSRRSLLHGTGFVVVSAAGLSLLDACGDNGSNSPSAASTSGAAGKPKEGGTLRLGMTGGSSTDNADVHFASSNWDYMLAPLLFDRLNADFVSGGFDSMLAEEITLDATATQCTVRLRKGVEFHNSKTVGADDLVFTIQRIIDPKKPGSVASLLNIDATSLKKVDDLTVSFTLTSPNSFLPSHFAAMQSGIVPVGFDPSKPVGAGPFSLASLQPGQGAKLTKFANYWNTPAHVDGVVIQNYASSSSLVSAISTGAADVAATFSLADLPTLQAASGVKVLTHQAGGFYPYVMKSDSGPFADVRARQGLRLAVDRNGLVQQLLSGQGRVANDLFSPDDANFASDIAQREQDLDQAKSLLKAAGVDGLTLPMATSPFLSNAEVVLAQQLKAVGITVNVSTVDATTFYAKHYAQDPVFVSSWLNQPLARINGLCYVPNAHFPETGWSDPDYSSLLTQAQAATDDSTRRDLQMQMQQIYNERGPWLIWGYQDEVDAVRDNVQNVVQDTSGFPFGRFLAFKNLWLS